MRPFFLLSLAVVLTGCGYVGEPLPPALQRPLRVVDLAGVERGSNIVVQFSMPKFTTEGLTILKDQDVELRYGVCPVVPFRFDEWEKVSERVKDVPQDISRDPDIVRVEIPATKFLGKDLVIGVRVHGPHGRDTGWGNMVAITIVPPLPTPLDLTAKDDPVGIRLDWHATAGHFRVYRRLKSENTWIEIGQSDKPSFVDSNIQYEKEYEYFAQTVEKAGQGQAESEPSDVIAFMPKDTFPPAVPTGLNAVPGARSIELLWDRNTEKDLAGYYVYRDGKRLGDKLVSPAYSDKTVIAGTSYKYQVSSIDNAGNESAKSAVAEALLP